MRRAVILVTLTLLLLAVAGVTVATENTVQHASRGQTESTVPEYTGPEPTAAEATAPETTVPETTVPEATAPEDVEEPDERPAEATSLHPKNRSSPAGILARGTLAGSGMVMGPKCRASLPPGPASRSTRRAASKTAWCERRASRNILESRPSGASPTT